MKKIKNTILKNIAVLLMLAVTVSSCSSFLEEKPYSVKTDKWTSQADAEVAVNKLYDSGLPTLYENRNNGWQPTRLMYGGLLSGLFVDGKKDGDFAANVETMNINFQTVNDDITNLYRISFEGIGRCNLVIARLPGMAADGIVSEDKKNGLMAQTYFFRALSYFFLVKEFGCKDGEAKGGGNGGVPLVLEFYETTDPGAINKPRASINDVYKQIEADLTEAIKLLPNTTFYSNGSRITRPAAQALLASVYLQWAGYPVQNTAMYEKAAQMAEAIITGGGGHDLESSTDTYLGSAFNKIKSNKTAAAKEIIYAIEYNQPLDKGNPYINSCMTSQATTWTLADGKSKVFKTSVLENMYRVSDQVIDSYVAGDVRAVEKNFFFRTYTSSNGTAFNCNQNDNWFWFDDASMVNGVASSLNFPVFRMADVYLIAAEALLKQSSANEPKARGYVEKVRQRAFTVNGVLDAGYSLPATITIDDVLTERLHEFPLELKVWDDIRRNRIYPQAQADNSLQWVDIATADTYNKRDGKTFKNNQHMLIWPIPQSAIERNPSLSQNPGY